MSNKEPNTKNLSQHEQDLQRLANFTLLDDDFMTAVFADNIPSVQYVLDVILGLPDLKIETVQVQETLKNLRGHSVRLDIYAVDDQHRHHNIEIQAGNYKATLQRARYYSSMIDARILDKGKDYSELEDTYVVFITKEDIFEKGLPIYHLDRCIRETGEYKDDGSHILFVNASYDSNDRIGELMHDFRCADPDELISPVIAERFTYLKKDEKGRESMCQMMEEMRNEAALQAALEKSRSIALKMIEKGTYPLEEISDITGLPVEEVKLIAANKSA